MTLINFWIDIGKEEKILTQISKSWNTRVQPAYTTSCVNAYFIIACNGGQLFYVPLRCTYFLVFTILKWGHFNSFLFWDSLLFLANICNNCSCKLGWKLCSGYARSWVLRSSQIVDTSGIFIEGEKIKNYPNFELFKLCLLYTSPSPRDFG